MIFCLIQHFETDLLQKVSLKILNSVIILKTFTNVLLKCNTQVSGEIQAPRIQGFPYFVVLHIFGS